MKSLICIVIALCVGATSAAAVEKRPLDPQNFFAGFTRPPDHIATARIYLKQKYLREIAALAAKNEEERARVRDTGRQVCGTVTDVDSCDYEFYLVDMSFADAARQLIKAAMSQELINRYLFLELARGDYADASQQYPKTILKFKGTANAE